MTGPDANCNFKPFIDCSFYAVFLRDTFSGEFLKKSSAVVERFNLQPYVLRRFSVYYTRYNEQFII